MESLKIMNTTRFCPECKTMQIFHSRCNGGLKKRFRCNDFPEDPEFYRGQVRAVKPEAVYVDEKGETPIRRFNSEDKELHDLIHDKPKFKEGNDVREERREVLKHKTRRTRGTLPIVHDLKQINVR